MDGWDGGGGDDHQPGVVNADELMNGWLYVVGKQQVHRREELNFMLELFGEGV